ncbi:MAG: hypothetical protein NTV46_00720 [Verrucomicrobia bacterium]|nr:hypothetical protein [Verrucomicrobiota bacterium]
MTGWLCLKDFLSVVQTPICAAQSAVPTVRNVPSLVFGILSVVFAVPGLLICWIPFFGVFGVGAVAFALVFAVIGIVIALCNERRDIGMPLLGAAISGGVLIVMFLSTCVGMSLVSSSTRQSSERVMREQERLKGEAEIARLSRLTDRVLHPQTVPVVPAPTIERIPVPAQAVPPKSRPSWNPQSQALPPGMSKDPAPAKRPPNE